MRVVESAWLGVNLPGVTLEGWDFTGSMIVTAADVTIRNCRFRPSADGRVAPLIVTGDGFSLDNTMFAVGRTGGRPAPAAIQFDGAASATVSRTVIVNTIDGIKLADSELTVTDTSIELADDPDAHQDGIQLQGGTCRLELDDVYIRGPRLGNAGVFAKSTSGTIEIRRVRVVGFGWGLSMQQGAIHATLDEFVAEGQQWGRVTAKTGASWSQGSGIIG